MICEQAGLDFEYIDTSDVDMSSDGFVAEQANIDVSDDGLFALGQEDPSGIVGLSIEKEKRIALDTVIIGVTWSVFCAYYKHVLEG